MNNGGLLDYYLALLSVQMAVLGFVIAGIVALIQIINAAKPRRETRLLIRRRALVIYVLFLTAVLLGLGVAAWSIGFGAPSTSAFFAKPTVGFLLLILCLVGLFWFVFLTYKARRLLEAEQYLEHYIATVPAQRVQDYLFRIYATRPDPYEPDLDETKPAVVAEQKKLLAERQRQIAVFDRRYARHKDLIDPFQPIREYVKDNAFKYYDAGTARGLYFFGVLYQKAFEAVAKNPQPNERFFLARYLAENSEELFGIFRKTMSEKRRIGTIRMLGEQGQQFINKGESEGFLTIMRGLESLAKIADDEDEIILCLDYMRRLLDAYLAKHAKATWIEVGDTFEQACLSVTRLAEYYYLERTSQLRTLPNIAQASGEYQTVTGKLVDFFTSYSQLADRFTDAYPVHYFEAIEAVIEALLVRYGEITQAGRAAFGQNWQYRQYIIRLYEVYRAVGLDAIEHRKPDLLALCLGNLRRIIKPAKLSKLADERRELTIILVELAIQALSTMPDVPIKGERTISRYVTETLNKHATQADVEVALKTIATQPGVDLRRREVRPFITAIRKPS